MAMEFSIKQLEYIREANHRWNVKCGATGAGKTFIDYFYMIPQRILERKGKRGLNVIMGLTRDSIERNVLQPMREVYGDLVGIINSRNICKMFGENVYCLGAEKSSQAGKIQGSTIKYLYCDEVAKWNEEVFQFVKSRLRTEVSCADLTCNPEHPEHFFKKFLDSDADIYHQHYVIDDNPFYPLDQKEELKKEYAGTVYYDRYILGLWTRAEGLVYPMFDKNKHVISHNKMPDGFEKYYVSADYGTMNPCVFIVWGLRGGVWHAVKEYYYSGKDKTPRTDEEHYNQLCDLLGRILPEYIIIDPSAASFITLIQRKKKYKVLQADNAVLDGIRETATVINRNILRFSSRCKNTIDEFGMYLWNPKYTEDTVIKEHDHAMDAVRYFVKTMKLERLQSR